MTLKTDVLIIGGGFGGVAAAQKLAENGIDVTLVDRKDYFEVTFAMLRNVANPTTIGNSARKHYRDFIQGTFIQTGVDSMNGQEAKLTNGETIQFERAIIASGSRYPTLPIAKTNSAYEYGERNRELAEAHKQLESAQSVLIIGGGAVGVEFAGEISSAFPNKAITLAHAGDVLLENSPPKAQRKALEQLTAKGVAVKFNRMFAKEGDLYRCSISKETIQPDIAYVCVGMVPNTEFLQNELATILDKRGFVKVDSFMKVEGQENLYALGDCATLDNRKHGYLASVQGGMLADIMLKEAAGKKVKPYNNPIAVVVTPTGTETGVAQLPFGVTTLKFIVNLKLKDVGISNMFKLLGIEPDAINQM